MSNSKRSDPFKTLLKIAAILAAALVVCFGASYGIGLWRASALDRQISQIEAENEALTEEYNLALAEYQSATQKGESLAWPTVSADGWQILDLTSFELENTRQAEVTRAEMMNGGLLLINQWHSQPSDFSEEGLLSLGNAISWRVPTADANVRLFQPAIDALDLMVIDAKAAGMEYLYVPSAYRSMADQQALFDKTMESLSSKYSGDTLIEQTKKSANYPGTSEYQSGLSFDMKLYNKSDASYGRMQFQTTDQGKWITENCWKYGIVFRFPTDGFPSDEWESKTYKTGISISLNLYRYVGKAHAAAMRTLNMCLEEYVEYLQSHPHIAIYENGSLRYEVYRMTVNDATDVTIQVPLAAISYTASLDNMGGAVMAYSYQ